MAEAEKTLKPYDCDVEQAALFREWIAARGGIFVWESINFSNLGACWCTPAKKTTGETYTKPNNQCGNTPARHITSEDEIRVVTAKEAKRFRVGVRMGAQGMQLKVTDGGTRRIRAAVAKAGEGAYYLFDYSTQEAVIFKPDKVIPLKDWQGSPTETASAVR